jgi:hypothetical protein
LGAQHGKLDADLRTSGLLGTPSVQSAHDYYPFALEDGGMLAAMALELADRLAILVQIVPSMAWVMLTFVFCGLTFMPVCNISFVVLLQ